MNYYGDTLYHHGIKGQKWGLRRFQNEDGSLTAAGREHYGYGAKAAYIERVGKAKHNYKNNLVKSVKANSDSKGNMTKSQIKNFDIESKRLAKELIAEKKVAKEEYKNSDEYKARQEKIKKAVKVGAAVAGTALAAYGAYKLSNAIKDKAFQMSYNKGKKYAESILDSNMATGWTGFKDGSYELLNSKHQAIEKGKLNLSSWQKPTTQIAQLQGLNNMAAFKTYSNAMNDVRKDAEEVSKNTLTAAKYLLKNRKK